MSIERIEAIQRAAQDLAKARSALFITGAGISAASGIPTYRGVGGLYGDRPTDEGLPIEEIVSGPMFRRSPEITWKYLHEIERACRGAKPNPAHFALAKLSQRVERSFVLTQNVDGFHRAAGSRDVIDIHGDLHRLLCTSCDYTTVVNDYEGLAMLPRCPSCKSIVRPDIVLFGEMLPGHKIALLQREVARGFDVVMSIGTSSLFPYIVEPVLVAAKRGASTIEVNPELTTISSRVSLRLALGAVEALTGIVDALEKLSTL